MIDIKHKEDCCGCSACVQCCPKQCIAMHEDEEGFLYPKADTSLCIDCGLCEKVCPVINQGEPHKALNVYAAKNEDEEIRRQSSSGGVFTILAEKIISENGVVFGARFNENWEVVHDCTETIEGLAPFRGSKYVQSRIGNAYKDVRDFLKQDRKVLFSGTPCQVAGLKKFLRKEYENLVTVDFICHGVSSPGVFRWYLAEEMEKIARQSDKKYSFALQSIPSIPKADVLAGKAGYKIEDIRFRDKTKGWKKYSFALRLSKASADGEKNSVLLSNILSKNPFLRGFLKDIYLRPSCYECPSKAGKSGSDITIADYWGIYSIIPELDDDKGVSAIVVNTAKGKEIFESIKAVKHEVPYEDLCHKNPSLIRPVSKPQGRKQFYTAEGKSFHERIELLCKTPIKTKIKRGITTILFAIIGTRTLGKIKKHLKR